jgi:uncharacterized membrane protein YgdD (TMEM256/DUF423 family)
VSGRGGIAAGALLALLGVGLGAFGAHGLEERLVEAGQLENWHTAVRYQMWHALALIATGLLAERAGPLRGTAGCFLVGTLLFSGSIYALALGAPAGAIWWVTPLGGLLLMAGWLVLAARALRASRS